MTDTSRRLCIHCHWGLFEIVDAGICANTAVTELATAKARAVGGSCGIEGKNWKVLSVLEGIREPVENDKIEAG